MSSLTTSLIWSVCHRFFGHVQLVPVLNILKSLSFVKDSFATSTYQNENSNNWNLAKELLSYSTKKKIKMTVITRILNYRNFTQKFPRLCCSTIVCREFFIQNSYTYVLYLYIIIENIYTKSYINFVLHLISEAHFNPI